MGQYENLIKALRCKRDDCEGCDLAFLDKDEGWMCQYAAKDDDAAAAIEELQQIAAHYEQSAKDWWQEAREYKIKSAEGITAEESKELIKRFKSISCGLIEQLPKLGEWELIDGAEPMRWGCSRCKYLSWETSNYCPRCGAKMEVQDGV